MEDHEVRYLVIGGVAASLHGVPRSTFDLDILIEPTEENAERLLRAFLDAGLGTAALTSAEEMLREEITVFRDRVRIDVQTSTPGITFDAAWENRVVMEYAGQKFSVVSRADLVASKRAAGRDIDLDDVRQLEASD